MYHNVIRQHAAHWETLGTCLGLEDHEIEIIQKDYHNQAVDACTEMLMRWLRVVPSPTWGNLDDTIKSMMTDLVSNPRGKSCIT